MNNDRFCSFRLVRCSSFDVADNETDFISVLVMVPKSLPDNMAGAVCSLFYLVCVVRTPDRESRRGIFRVDDNTLSPVFLGDEKGGRKK